MYLFKDNLLEFIRNFFNSTYKILFFWCIFLIGGAFLLAKPSVYEQTPTEIHEKIFLENDKIRFNISDTGLFHSVILKNYNNHILLRDPIKGKDCIDLGSDWVLKKNNEKELIFIHKNKKFIRRLYLDNDKLIIEENNPSNSIISIEGNGSGNDFFILSNNKKKELQDTFLSVGFSGKSNKKYNLQKMYLFDGDSCGKSYKNFLINITEEGVKNSKLSVEYLSTRNSCKLIVGDFKKISLIFLPAKIKVLEEKNLDAYFYYGWFPSVSKRLCYLLDLLIDQTQSILGLFLFVLFIVLLQISMIYEDIKKKKKISASKMEIDGIRTKYAGDIMRIEQETFFINEKYKTQNKGLAFGLLNLLSNLSFYYGFFYATVYCFDLNNCSFLWLNGNLLSPESFSIFNLYGRLNIQLPNSLIIGVLPILSVIFSYFVILSGEDTPEVVKENKLIIALFFLSIYKKLPASSLIYFLFFYCLKILISYIIEKFYYKL